MQTEDLEDILECECYIILCIAKDNRVFSDRVYRSKDMTRKRIEYLNKMSQEKGEWFAVVSFLGS